MNLFLKHISLGHPNKAEKLVGEQFIIKELVLLEAVCYNGGVKNAIFIIDWIIVLQKRRKLTKK